MKMKGILTTLVLVGIMQISPGVFAQDTDQPGKGWNHNQGGRLASLSPADRQKVEAAHQTAMQDPTVQAAREKMRLARKEFEEAMHAAMIKADPSIATILEKIPRHEKPEE